MSSDWPNNVGSAAASHRASSSHRREREERDVRDDERDHRAIWTPQLRRRGESSPHREALGDQHHRAA